MDPTRQDRRRLLLLEDDRATYTALRRVLTLRGWDVVLATTLADGRRAIGGRLDAAVIDLMLPDGDGDEVVREVRERYADLPIAVTTGVNDAERLAAVRRSGASVLLRKPIAVQELLSAIELAPAHGRPT